MMAHALLTDRGLAQCAFPELPQRLSQRVSRSRTQAVNPRTFDALAEWPNFMAEAVALSANLDNVAAVRSNPLNTWPNGLEPASDENDIRSGLNSIIFPQVNLLADMLGLSFKFVSGGSGRSLSFTDMVVLDRSQQQNLSNLSARVYGNGEAKGYWQWELNGLTFEEALNSTNKGKMCIEVLQQLFGDMVLDESLGGFVTNYNETVFFYRESGRSKKLYYSPVVRIGDAPVEKFLYALHFIEQRKHLKSLFSRDLVKETPRSGYRLKLPQLQYVTSSGRLGKRKAQMIQVKASKKTRGVVAYTNVELYDEERLCDIPAYSLDDLHVNGNILGMGKYGNVLQAELHGEKLALKTYDMRCGDAALTSYVKEQRVYHHLEDLQGRCVPSLLLVGRLPHTSVFYLGLTNEAGRPVRELLKSGRTNTVEQAILSSLDEIHQSGVMHGDLSLSNVLFKSSAAKFIDFEYSVINASKADLDREIRDMEELLVEQAAN